MPFYWAFSDKSSLYWDKREKIEHEIMIRDYLKSKHDVKSIWDVPQEAVSLYLEVGKGFKKPDKVN